jgi:hypothetical protein
MSTDPSPNNTTNTPQPMDIVSSSAEEKNTSDNNMVATAAAAAEPPPIIIDEAENKKSISQMVDMGFTASQAEYALKQCKNNAEEALNWLLNATEAQLKDAGAPPASQTANSYKCTTTGKLFRTMADAMIYAERTGHTDFEESSEIIPPLTTEEKAERLKRVRELIKEKIKIREEKEKKEEVEREKNRRKEGQNMSKIREEQAALQLKRDAEARDKEKQRFAVERERLRVEAAKDVAERAREKAERLKTGDPMQAYKEAYDKFMRGGSVEDVDKKIEACLSVYETFRSRGLEAIRTIIKMLNNVIKNPSEPKFKRVNLQNEAFKTKVAFASVGIILFEIAGFKKVENGTFLELPSDVTDFTNMNKVVETLTAAEKTNRFA